MLSINSESLFAKFFKIYFFEKVYFDTQNIIDILDINYNLYHFFNKNFLSFNKKWLFLYIIFHLNFFSSLIIRLIKLTFLKKKRISYSIIKKWIRINIITGFPLSLPIEEYLINFFKKRNKDFFYLKKKVKENILGGLTIRINDKEWDSSLNKKLKKFRIYFNFKRNI